MKYSFEFWEDFTGCQTGLETIAPPPQPQPVSTETQTAASTAARPGNSADWPYWPIANSGSTISSSSAQPAAQAASQPVYHTVTKGQTMWGLAQRYGVSLSRLIELNPQIKNPNLIYIGQSIRVK